MFHVRPKTLNFEQLVAQNRQEIIEDEKRTNKIEIRLEKKQTDLTNENPKKQIYKKL